MIPIFLIGTPIRLPGMSGLEVQSKLNETGAQIPIIFITSHGDIPMTVKAIKSGAVEFLTKPFRDQDLIDAIQQALKSNAQARPQQSELAELQERYAKLTVREREVMHLIVSGMLTKQIASTLGTTEITVTVALALGCLLKDKPISFNSEIRY
jgi:FixJ family two-component response regulator